MLGNFKRKIKNWFKSSYKNQFITPDEIFLDSSNLSGFDTDQFEGRLEKPISQIAIKFLLICFLFLALAYSSKIWALQIKQGNAYLERSENNRLRTSLIFSNRGIISDRNGKELVTNIVSPEGEDFSKRNYPELPGFSHLLGYIKYPTKDKAGFYWETNFVGQDGVESFYNNSLIGENGLKIVETDALGNIQTQNMTSPPTDGKSFRLSVDFGVQNKLFEIIKSAVENYKFQGGSGIIIDVETGEILALTNFPEYNSTILSEGNDKPSINGFIQDPLNPFLNRAISGLYVPGSVIKPFIAIASLNENLVSPNKKILSTGSISIPNPYFPDKPSVFTDWKAHGWVDLIDALAVSSNVYFYSLGGGYGDQKGLGIEKIEKYLREFGFGQKSGIDLPGEKIGVIPNPEWKKKTFGEDDWRLGDTYNTSIGQYGVQFTPIQILRGIAAIANDGTLLTPSVLKGGVKQSSVPIEIKKEAFAAVKEGMKQAVLRGTASGLNVSYVQVGAKTGTAEIGKQSLNSWVTGFFPYENPKYAFVITMERGPRANSTGGVYVMRQLFDWMNANTPEYLK
ncbi:MAG: penicillin-binding transpeptidase domain-containing protein [Patescibacteria group bacterium]